MIVDHSDGLHEGVNDGGADELEASSFEILAEGIRFGSGGRQSRPALVAFSERRASDEFPAVGIKGAEFGLNLKKRFRIADGGADLPLVSNDVFVLHEAAHIAGLKLGDFLRVEVVEGFSVAVAALENGEPAQSGLGSFQNEVFEEDSVVVDGASPFLIVIGDVDRVGEAPSAAGGEASARAFHHGLA